MPLLYSERLGQRIAGQEKGIPGWVNDKVRLGEFCRELEVPFPETFRVFSHPSELDLGALPTSFVLKPNRLHSSWGVMVLTRHDHSDLYHDAITGKDFSATAVRDFQTEIYESKVKNKTGYRLMVEEKIDDYSPENSVPLDYKLFCFHGVTELVVQYNRNTRPRKTAFYDGDFRPLILQDSLVTDWKRISRGEHHLTPFWRDMLDLAGIVTRNLATPFMRVDFFSSTRGAVLGELTPAPGGLNNLYSFTEQFDRRLGTAWAEAEARLS